LVTFSCDKSKRETRPFSSQRTIFFERVAGARRISAASVARIAERSLPRISYLRSYRVHVPIGDDRLAA